MLGFKVFHSHLNKEMEVVKVFEGDSVNSFETALKVEGYPYGRLTCTMYKWIETVKNKGSRIVEQTTNPKRDHALNNPHKSVYHSIIMIVEFDNGHYGYDIFDSVRNLDNTIQFFNRYYQYMSERQKHIMRNNIAFYKDNCSKDAYYIKAFEQYKTKFPEFEWPTF